MRLKACAMDWRRNRIARVGKNSAFIVSRLWTKVHQVLVRCTGPLVFFNALARLSASCFVQMIFAIKSRSRRKTEHFLAPNFWGGASPTFLRQINSVLSTAWQSLVEFRLLICVCETWQWSRMQNDGGQKLYGPILSRLWTRVHELLRQCKRPLVVSNALVRLCIVFHSEQIDRWTCR